MAKPHEFLVLEDVYTPETQPELFERLRTDSRNARRSSGRRPAAERGTRSPKNLHFVSPMRRGESAGEFPHGVVRASASPACSNAARLAPVPWIPTMQDPHSSQAIWQNPGFRKAMTNIVAFAAFFFVVFLLITMGQSEPAAPENEIAANVPDEESESKSPSEEPAKSEANEPAEEPTPEPATSQVTLQVDSPNRVTIAIDDSVYPNTEKVTLPLTPGPHRLKITKDGYEPYEGTIDVADIPEQTLPAVSLAAIGTPTGSEPAALPIQVVSKPANAIILAEGEPTGYTTPATLPRDLAKGSLSVRLEGYVIRDVVSERNQDTDVLTFSLEPIPAKPIPTIVSSTNPAGYGFQLNEAESRSLASALDKLLNEDWNASAETGISDAKSHLAVWGPFTRRDPRLDHAYGLVLWHHGEFKQAKEAMTAAVQREKTRPGQIVPYYPLYRDKIRLESVTNDEVLAAEDLLDLIQDTAKTLKHHPQAGRLEAIENADFAGRLLGFLEGPSRAKLSDDVNLRLLNSRIDASFPDEDLRGTYRSARIQVQEQYQEELQAASAKRMARDAKERELQESGELGRTKIRAKEFRNTGRYIRSDANSQLVTPYRIPDVTDAFITDRGLLGISRGPVFVPFNNLLFSSGPAISRSFVNNRTNDTTKVTEKQVFEKLPSMSFRRPSSLNTYMPQELERKRRDLLESVSGE